MGELITQRALEKLRAKERAHDDYLAALKQLAQKRARLRGLRPEPAVAQSQERYMAGYDQAIKDLSQFTADAVRARLTESGQ